MLDSEETPEVKLKEFLGHTPMQVCCGAVLGFIVALALGQMSIGKCNKTKKYF